eukprot:9469818-Pyramimonas_sp.AAC.1
MGAGASASLNASTHAGPRAVLPTDAGSAASRWRRHFSHHKASPRRATYLRGMTPGRQPLEARR